MLRNLIAIHLTCLYNNHIVDQALPLPYTSAVITRIKVQGKTMPFSKRVREKPKLEDETANELVTQFRLNQQRISQQGLN